MRLRHDFGRIPVHPPPFRVQAKLVVGAPGDQFEREADRIAAQVMGDRAQASHYELHRTAAGEIRAKGAASEPAGGRLDASGNGGTSSLAEGTGAPLPQPIRAYMEPRFGVDFSSIRIHTDAHADGLNRTLHARAFTLGREIFFRHGEYSPGTRTGQALIAHELTHVVQQAGGSGPVAAPPATGAGGVPGVRNGAAISPAGLSIQRDIVGGPHKFPSGEMSINFKTKEGIAPRDELPRTAGEEGTITFKPTQDAPDLERIRFVQIVKTVDTKKDKDFKWRGSEAPRNKMRTAADEEQGVEKGFFVDQNAGELKKRRGTKEKVLPYYDWTTGGVKNFTGGKKGGTSRPAILADWPRSNFPLKYDFVTSAIETGAHSWLGSVAWGFEVVCEKGVTTCCVKNEYHKFQAEQGATTDAALKKFNQYYRIPGFSNAPK